MWDWGSNPGCPHVRHATFLLYYFNAMYYSVAAYDCNVFHAESNPLSGEPLLSTTLDLVTKGTCYTSQMTQFNLNAAHMC